jgi:hypothetical protein
LKTLPFEKVWALENDAPTLCHSTLSLIKEDSQPRVLERRMNFDAFCAPARQEIILLVEIGVSITKGNMCAKYADFKI